MSVYMLDHEAAAARRAATARRLKDQGASIISIARELGVARSTVYGYLERPEPTKPPEYPPLHVIDADHLPDYRTPCQDPQYLPNQWYPEDLPPTLQHHARKQAVDLCNTCPVRLACLERELQFPPWDQHGVFGGMVAAERKRLIRQRRKGRAA